MGTTMTLIKVVQKLDELDQESTIYASKPWTENSRVIVLREPESGELPSEAKQLALTYFLEVFIARDFLEEWASSLDIEPTPQKKCARLIQYATSDA